MPQFKVRYHIPYSGFYPGGDFAGTGTEDAAVIDAFASRMLQAFETKLLTKFPGSLDESTMTLTTDAVPADPGSIAPPNANGWTGLPGQRYYRFRFKPLVVAADNTDPARAQAAEDKTHLDELMDIQYFSEREADRNTGEIHLTPVATGGRKSRRNRRTGRRKARKSRTTRRH